MGHDPISPGEEYQIDQHVTAGTYYFEVESRSGAGRYILTPGLESASPPFQGLGSGEGTPPIALVFSDFNADGIPDLATANYRSGDVSVLLGNGNGSFQGPERFKAGDLPISIAAEDFDGDGHLDLATANTGSSDVPLLLGRGDGSFRVQVRFAVGGRPQVIAAGDFNRDGRLDLTTANIGSGDVSVLLGRGDGTSRPEVRFAAGNRVQSLAPGDFNGDGRLDLATANSGSDDVSVLLGRGNGSFLAAVNFAAGKTPQTITAADLNKDGRTDLAIANASGGSVLLGRCDGTFLDAVPSAVPPKSQAIVVEDFDGDHLPDLAIANFGSGDVSVRLARSVLLGLEPVQFAVGTLPLAITAGDFNGDGRLDLATANAVSDDVSVALNFGSGRFVNPGPFAIAPRATPLVADLGQDGTDDVLVINRAGEILWRKGRPHESGTFEPPRIVNPGGSSRDVAVVESRQGTLIASVNARNNMVSLFAISNGEFAPLDDKLPTGLLPAQIATADLNGDSHSDLVVRSAGDGSASIFFGDGSGNYSKRFVDLRIGLGASDIRLDDVDQSGTIDLVVTNQSTGDVRILFNRGDATFSRESRYHAGTGLSGLVNIDGTPTLQSLEETAGVAIGTFTRGGVPGLATLNPGSNSFAVLDGLGGGAFANPRHVPTSRPAQVIRSADFNGDGVSDVVLLSSDGLSVYLGDGRGWFTMPFPPIDAGPNPTGLSVADANRDRQLDVLVGNDFGDVLLLLGKGDGTFQPYLKADRGVALAVADIDRDGHTDQVFASQAMDQVSVVYGTRSTRSAVVGDRSSGLLAPGAVAGADLNQDGKPDLIVANSGSNNVLIYPGLGNGRFGPALNGGNGFFADTNPVGITVADVNADGRPDLVVANRGSNDVSILLGRGKGSGWALVPGPRLRAGTGPVSTVVQDFNGDGRLDVLAGNSLSNDVRLIPGVGGGFFNDRNVTTIPVGINPGPLFVGNFDGRPGLDLITINQGSNDLTLASGFAGRDRVLSSLSSGGSSPVAGLGFDSNGDGVFDGLVVANNGDGRLAFFLGGSGGLSLAQIFRTPALPHPTALALNFLGNGELSFFAATEGQETALRLSLTFGGGATQLIAQLVPLRPEAQALVATLLTVALDMSLSATQADAAATPIGAEALATFSNVTTVSPAQDASQSEDQDEAAAETDDAEEKPDDAQEDASEEAPPWIWYFAGLDERFDQHRRSALDEWPTGSGSPAAIARWLSALDVVLDRWTLAERVANGGQPGPTERLRQAAGKTARVLDAAIHRLGSAERPRVTPPSPPILEPARLIPSQAEEDFPQRPAEAEAAESSAASVPLVLIALLLARRARPPLRRQGPRPIACAGGRSMPNAKGALPQLPNGGTARET